jgi:hypothetical protein
VVDAPVSLVDLAPTLLAGVGLPRPARMSGDDLGPLVHGRPWDRPVFAETGSLRRVTLAREALVADLDDGTLELFDLDRDPRRRFLDADRPTIPWAQLDASVLDDEERELVRRAWAARVDAEYRSMVVFGELIARMPEAGVSLEASCAASRLLQDEARHTELCARVADALGGHPEARFDATSLRLDDDHPAHLFVARWTASMFCVGEAASVGLLQVLAARTTDPCAKVVVEILLRDELLHDRFGWALAAEVFPRLSDDEREWLAADLAFAFAHYDRIDAGCLRPDGAALPEEPDDERDRWRAKNLGVS